MGKWWSCAPRLTPARSLTSVVEVPAYGRGARHIEHALGTGPSEPVVLPDSPDVELYVDAMERLCVDADQPERTPVTLRRILKDT